MTLLRSSVFLLALLCAAPTWAGVLGGVVQSVRGRQITVEYGNQGKVKVFHVPTRAKVLQDALPGRFESIQVGTAVSVYTTTSGQVYKVRVKSGDRANPKPSTPDVSRVIPEIRPGGTEKVESKESWAQFRGPDRANRSLATGLLKEWPADGPRVAQVYRGLGAGYSSAAFDGKRLFTMGTQGNDEVVIAFAMNEISRPLWSIRTGTIFRDGTGDGPRGTPSVDDGFVYALGANGDLACVAAESGTVKWRKNVLQEFGAANITWGISESPLVDGNRVVVTPGGQAATMVALEKSSGRTLWRSIFPGGPGAAYASAIVSQLGTVRQYVNFTSKGVIGVHADTGTPLWGNDATSNGTANCPTPLDVGSAIFSASGYGTGGGLVKLAAGRNNVQAQLAYKVRELVNHHGGMVFVNGYVYGTNDNALVCVDVKNGDVLWRDRSVGKGSVTYADGHLYVVGEAGEIALVEASPDGYVEKGRFKHVNRSDKRLWAHPVVFQGRLYVRDQDTLTVYDVSARD